jgi:hypothetical protein
MFIHSVNDDETRNELNRYVCKMLDGYVNRRLILTYRSICYETITPVRFYDRIYGHVIIQPNNCIEYVVLDYVFKTRWFAPSAYNARGTKNIKDDIEITTSYD